MASERLARMQEARLGQLLDLLEEDHRGQLRQMELAESREEFLRQQGVTRYLTRQIERITTTLKQLQRGDKPDGRSERTGY